MTGKEIIEPSWSVFAACRRCGAETGQACLDMRGRWCWPTTRAWTMRNPHRGRKKLSR